ncbi:MAG TPA: hypothetical protein VK598_02340 [Nitrospiraceae bacterium]|nr:hypothetical protein [Nitrospiraceae bacterium]
MTSDEDPDASAVDPAKLRRFAIGVGSIMLVFVAAGGTQADNNFTIETLKISLSRPSILLWLVPIVSLYAALRYWWYGIQIPMTRTKIRKYLRHTRSLLIIKTYEEVYRTQLKQEGRASVYLPAHQELETKVPPGLTPFRFIVFTDSATKPDEIYMLQLCRNRINAYFPGITAMDFAVDETQDHLVWASPSKLRFSTRVRVFLENCDVWLPISLNSVGVLAYLLYVSKCY